jgi:hypothetical protein
MWVADPKKYNDVGVLKKAGAFLESIFKLGGEINYLEIFKTI